MEVYTYMHKIQKLCFMDSSQTEVSEVAGPVYPVSIIPDITTKFAPTFVYSL